VQGWSKAAVYLATALIGAGFLLIVLAWNGAASVDYVQGQVPYIISGGLGGLAMVGAGLALAVVQSNRQDRLMLTEKLDELIDTMHRGATGGPTAVPEDSDDRVVAGRTTYHRPTCQLVEGRADLQVMAVGSAVDRGLAPCRVCEPAREVA